MRFKIGQQVVCVAKSWRVKTSWFMGLFSRYRNSNYGPRYNEVVTVSGNPLPGYIFLQQYPGPADGIDMPAYSEICFEPLITDEELVSELETITEFMT